MGDNETIYEFGDFRLDIGKRTLFRDESRVPITKKMYDILLLLIENADRVVEKQEIMQRIWHDRFVEENNLTYNIGMIRRALGDRAAAPVYIETIPRHGYRFIAAVIRSERHTSPPTSRVTPTPVSVEHSVNSSGDARSRRVFLAAAVAIILVTIGLGLGAILKPDRLFRSPGVLFDGEFHSTKISDTGKTYQSAISPDGKYVAYTSVVNGKESVWLRHLETANNTMIVPPADHTYAGLVFSRSGDTLFFARRVRTQQTGAGIYRMPVSGGLPAKIVDDAEGWFSVSPDDRVISFVRNEQAGGKGNRLLTVNVDGTNERVVSIANGPDIIWTHAFSPDGGKIAAARGHSSRASQEMGIVEIDLETGLHRSLTDARFFHVKDIEWLPDATALIFSADKNLGDPARIWQLHLPTGHVDQLTDDLVSYGSLTLSTKADSVVVTTLTPDYQLLLSEWKDLRSFKTVTRARNRFSFTPDDRIVYSSDAAGNEDIWIIGVDGSNQRQLTNDRGIDVDPVVSPDGQHVYFSSNRSGSNELWRMKIDGSDAMRLTAGGGGFPRFVTADGGRLFYESALTGSLMRIATDGRDEQVFIEGGYEHAFSPDGCLLAFGAHDPASGTNVITLLDVDARLVIKKLPLAFPDRRPFHVAWKDNRHIAYVLRTETGRSIWIQDVEGAPPQLFYDAPGDPIGDIEFSPHGDHVGIIRGDWRHDAVLLTPAR